MDLMFEDEADEVGSDVEGFCTKCKADTTHVVISKYEDEIRRVQCNVCGDVHSFRKPRGETEDEVPEPVSARKRALMKKPSWDEFFAKHRASGAKPYQFRLEYSDHALVEHPKFGVGFVSEVVSTSKVEITFKDGRRILVHNRRDIPGLPTGDGMPTGELPPGIVKAAKADGKAAKGGKPPGKDRAEPATEANKAVAAKVDAKPVGAAKPVSAPKAAGGKTEPAAQPPVAAKNADAEKAAGKASKPAEPAKGVENQDPAGKAKPPAKAAVKPPTKPTAPTPVVAKPAPTPKAATPPKAPAAPAKVAAPKPGAKPPAKVAAAKAPAAKPEPSKPAAAKSAAAKPAAPKPAPTSKPLPAATKPLAAKPGATKAPAKPAPPGKPAAPAKATPKAAPAKAAPSKPAGKPAATKPAAPAKRK